MKRNLFLLILIFSIFLIFIGCSPDKPAPPEVNFEDTPELGVTQNDPPPKPSSTAPGPKPRQTQPSLEKNSEDQPGPHPRIQFESDEFDFGTSEQNRSITHRYKFKNTGKADLRITNVRSTCGCTVPKWSKDPIPPGGEGYIETVFRTGHYLNRVTKTIRVETNDPTNKSVPLRITGIVRGYIVTKPDRVNFGRVKVKYPYERVVRVFPDTASSLKLKKVYAANDSWFEYTTKEYDHRDPNTDQIRKGLEIRIKIKPGYIGGLNGRIIIDRNDRRDPKIIIPVTAHVMADITTNRSSIVFRHRANDVRPEVVVIKSNSKDFNIKSLEFEKEFFKTETITITPSRVFAIMVWIDPSKTKKGKFEDKLIIKTTSEEASVFKIAVSAQVL